MTATSCKGRIFFIVDADGMISDKNIVFVDYIWMKSSIMKRSAIILIIMFCAFATSFAQSKTPRFKVIALYENGGHHVEYSKAAKIWLDKLAIDSNFSIDYIQNTDKINEEFLSHYQLFIQLDYAPYAWKPAAGEAFQKYIAQGKGGRIGVHHAAL